MEPEELRKLQTLLGGTITALARSGKRDRDQEIFGLVIRTKDRSYVLWLLEDFEGNGPGGFSLEPYRTAKR